jgi:hypothetical protein
MAEYAMARRAAKVNMAALIKPRESSGGTKLRRVVAIMLTRTAKVNHF